MLGLPPNLCREESGNWGLDNPSFLQGRVSAIDKRTVVNGQICPGYWGKETQAQQFVYNVRRQFKLRVIVREPAIKLEDPGENAKERPSR